MFKEIFQYKQRFKEVLQLNLNLTIQQKVFDILGANVKNFEISLYNYGFTAELDFWLSPEQSEDKLFPYFTTQDLIQVYLSIQGNDLPTPAPDPLIVQGLVTDKSVYETIEFISTNKTVPFRCYRIRFVDPARLLWSQHFPISLYADSTMAELIKRNTPKGLSLELDWPVLDVQHPILCLSMGDIKSKTSFYDFILWFIDAHKGVWNYDNHNNTYKISSKKNEQGSPSEFHPLDVERLQILFPETVRNEVSVLNSYADAAKKEDIPNEQGVEGVRRDYLMRSAVGTDLLDRKELERRRLTLRKEEIFLAFKRFPKVTVRPGKFYHFTTKWSENRFCAGKEYRLYAMKIFATAENQSPQHDRGKRMTCYDIEMHAKLELKEEECLSLPEFHPPYYPIFAEAKLVCPIGQPTDKTYQFIEDSKTSLHYYKVYVPLWNQTIIIPYIPNFLPGHMYFPDYRNQRVLLSIYFQNAEIDRFLDWGPDVRIPLETQGNHLLFGKNLLSQTSVKHVYEDDKPRLNIERTSGKDTQFIHVLEGCIIMQTEEKKSLPTTEEQYDLTPIAEMAKGEAKMKTQNDIGEFTAEFGTSKGFIQNQIGAAIAEVNRQLETSETTVTQSIGRVRSQLAAMTKQAGEKELKLQVKANTIKTELRKKSPGKL